MARTEEEARRVIAGRARLELELFGWRSGDAPGPKNQRIASRLCADAETRARQGGAHLAQVFSGAGHPAASKCLRISEAWEQNYRQGGYSRSLQETEDVPGWSGVFALYVCRAAGLRLSPWPLRSDIHPRPGGPMEWRMLPAPGEPLPGDIGLIDGIRAGGLGRHFVVVSVDGQEIHAIEGDARLDVRGGAVAGVIAATVRRRMELRPGQDCFLRAVWETVLQT